MTTPKHKKHKQRFEHTCETTPGGYVNLDKALRDKEKNGWELVTVAITVACEENFYTLFFKRPV